MRNQLNEFIMKNYWRTVVLVILALPVSEAVVCQVPSAIPMSPEAAALAKSVDYPVNMNTGVPDISIPFYEINVGGMKLPITLQYHAGGFRINEQATRAGLGWSLSSDLQITRTVNGQDDLVPTSGYVANSMMKAYYPNPSSCPSCDYPLLSTSPFPYANAYDLAMGNKDGMPDKFNYKLLDKSGSFFFQKNSAGTGYTIVPVPFDNIKIEYNDGQFIITDTDGTTYYFGETGGGDVNTLLAKGIEISGSIGDLGGCTNCVRSAWRCKRIENNTQSDEIVFSYMSKTIATYRSHYDHIEHYSNDNPCYLNDYHRSDQLPLSNPTLDYDGVLAQVPFHEISSPKYMEVFSGDGTAKFHVPYLNSSGQFVDRVYDNDGLASTQVIDIAGLSVSEISFRGGKVVFTGANELSYIRVLDDKGNEVKSLRFFHSYENATYTSQAKHYNGPGFQGTRYLDSLHVKNGPSTFERYALVYSQKYCFGNHLKGQDAWGYRNEFTIEIASSGGYTNLPRKTLIQPRYYFDVDGSCSNFDTDIPLVFGSYDIGEKAQEDYLLTGVLKRIVYPAGGYVDFDFEANQYEEEFENFGFQQSLPQVAGGLRIRSISYFERGNPKPVSQKYYRYGDLEQGTGILSSRPAPSFEPGVFYFEPASYTQQVAYLYNTGTLPCYDRNCLGVRAIETKTTYQPSTVLNYTYGNGAPIYYTRVSEYQQDLGVQTGKTVYDYYPPEEFHDFTTAPLYGQDRIDNTNISYIKTAALMGAQKSVTHYKYRSDLTYKPVRRKSFQYTRYLRPEQVRVVYAFLRVIYEIGEGSYAGTSQNLYDNSKAFAFSPVYPGNEYVMGEYGIPVGKLLLTQEVEEIYEGEAVQTITTDYAYSHLPYLQPSAITTTDSKGKIITQSIKYAYNFSGTGVYDQMKAANMISQPIEEIETDVTLGKQLSRKKTNYAEYTVGFGFIAPTSIQHSVKGQPLETDMTFDQYDQYANLLQQTGRDGITVSYLWGYGGLYPVAELRGASYSAIPTAYLSNVQITNPSSDASLRTVLTDLRNSFSGAEQVSTFTYERLVGISSLGAPNGHNTYYEYDDIGRLVAEKDHAQKLVNSYAYHMVGPSAGDMGGHYVNYPIMRTHSKLCPGNVRQVYNYIVPGGTHYSSSMYTAFNSAETEANNAVNPPPLPACPTSSYTGAIELRGLQDGVSGYPSKIEVDFIQDNSVVFTQKVNYNPPSGPYNYSTIHVPEGTYQLSIRPSAATDYYNGVMNYTFQAVDEGYTTYPRSGDTVTIVKDKSYVLLITNIQ